MTGDAYRFPQFSASNPGRTLRVCVLVLLCGGCVSSRHLASQAAPVFDPATFFAGATEGQAVLKIALRRAQRVVVEGQGRVDADGTLILNQSVRGAHEPATTRTWRLRRAGPDRWTGTLSDAAGPVNAQVTGNLLHLAFAMKGGLNAQQWLYLQPGGMVVRNVMVVRKLGMPVARLDETITRRRE